MAKDEKTITDEAPKAGHFYLECKRCGLHKNKPQAGFAAPVYTESMKKAGENPPSPAPGMEGALSGGMPTCDGCGSSDWRSLAVDVRNGVLVNVDPKQPPAGPMSAANILKVAGFTVIDETAEREEERKKNEARERIDREKSVAAEKARAETRAEQAKQAAAQSVANAEAADKAAAKAAKEAETKAAKSSAASAPA